MCRYGRFPGVLCHTWVHRNGFGKLGHTQSSSIVTNISEIKKMMLMLENSFCFQKMMSYRLFGERINIKGHYVTESIFHANSRSFREYLCKASTWWENTLDTKSRMRTENNIISIFEIKWFTVLQPA